ncbi:MAG TPA: hypothetical protein VL137_11290 [Polyangiaceae bacterium]|nr:hypothetical protein [Polyangiaceae bacterium]
MIPQLLKRLRAAFAELSGWDRLLAALCIGSMLFFLLQLGLFSYGRDQSIYALVAREMAQGKLPYRDVWDFKPPGIFFVYSFARTLLGASMLAPRLLEILGIGAMSAAFLYMGQQLVGSWLVGLIAAALATLLHVQLEFWHTGQPESFGGFITVIALALVISDFSTRRRQVWSELTVGALLGVTFLFKPPLAGAGIVIAAYTFKKGKLEQTPLRQTWASLLRFALGGAAVLGVCGAYFALRGGWPALSWTLFEFTPGYTKMSWQGTDAFEGMYHAVRQVLTKFSYLIPLGLVVLAFDRPLHTREREATFLFAGTVLVHLCGIAMQAKFFPYHYGATLPLLAWLVSLGLYKLWLRARRHGLLVIALLAALVWVISLRSGALDVPHGFWKRNALRTQYAFGLGPIKSREELDRQLYYTADFNLAADRDAARVITQRTPGNARIFVWGFEPMIYLFAQRGIASKYIYNVPQRAAWQTGRARTELMQHLQQLPDVVVVQHNDVFPAVTGDAMDSAVALGDFPELEDWLGQNYQALGSVEDFDLYVPSTLRYARAP